MLSALYGDRRRRRSGACRRRRSCWPRSCCRPSSPRSIRPRLAGICTAGGGPTSHVAILAASMGVPCPGRRGAAAWLEVVDGQALILDADRGQLHLEPEPWEVEAMRAALQGPQAARRHRPRRRPRAGAHRRRTAHRGASPISAPLAEAAKAVERARRAAACCAPSSCSWSARRRPTRTSSAPQYQAIADGARRPAADHPHARRRRRQAARLPASAARGEPGARPARRARQPVAAGPAARRSCAPSCA